MGVRLDASVAPGLGQSGHGRKRGAWKQVPEKPNAGPGFPEPALCLRVRTAPRRLAADGLADHAAALLGQLNLAGQ